MATTYGDVTIVLFVTQQEVESFTSINAATDKYFRPACVMAHTEGLCSIIGKPLYDAMCQDVSVVSADLLYNIKMFLIFATAANFAFMSSNKLANFGVVQSTDEHLQYSENAQIRTQNFWQNKADMYARKIQQGIIKDYTSYKSYIDAAAVEGMKANLYSFASCGIWLGGARHRD